MPAPTQAIVMAAGTSSRFNTSASKLRYTLCGQEMITYPLTALSSLRIATTVVLGYQKEHISKIISDHGFKVATVHQTAQRGTGHALLCTQEQWQSDTILVMNGDAPLITKEHITALLELHHTSQAQVSCIAAYNADPTVVGYGRIITKDDTISIVEQQEFTGDPAKECRLNAGVYVFNRDFVTTALPLLTTHDNGEFFITDLIHHASAQGKQVSILDIPFDEVRGINTLQELWVAERIIRSQIVASWMHKGVRFEAPESVIIDKDVQLSPDVTIASGVHLKQGTRVGKGATIGAYSILENATIEEQAVVHPHSVVHHSTVQHHAQVGPFAHVHRQSTLFPQSVVGNFVEISKTTLGSESKVKHLSYLGQTKVGKKANIGAGTITCNYDGTNKHATVIEDRSFVGSNSSLIAPVTIGKDAVVGAGSTITESVPPEALAIARTRQVTKDDYMRKHPKKADEPQRTKGKLAPQAS